MFKVRYSFRWMAVVALVALVAFLQLPTVTVLGQNRTSNGLTPSDLGLAVTGAVTTNGIGVNNSVISAPGTGVRNYLYQAMCITSGGTAGIGVIRDGSTTKAYIPCPANATTAQIISFDPPIQFTAATAVSMLLSGGAGTTVQFYGAGRQAR